MSGGGWPDGHGGVFEGGAVVKDYARSAFVVLGVVGIVDFTVQCATLGDVKLIQLVLGWCCG